MKNPESWRPSKYKFHNGTITASRDPNKVASSSLLITNIIAHFYQQALPKHARGKLLDLGCGSAPLYLAYRDLVSSNVCADWGNSFHKNNNLDVECDLTQPFPFNDGEFDTIIASDLLEHLPDPVLFWREAARILAPGGTILLNIPFFYWIHEAPHDYFRHTEFALRRLIDHAGLKLESIEPIGGSLEILVDLAAKHLKAIPGLGRVSAVLIQNVTWLFYATRLAARIRTKTAKFFPMGYFVVVKRASEKV